MTNWHAPLGGWDIDTATRDTDVHDNRGPRAEESVTQWVRLDWP
jgi:hypothetical protein